MILRKNTNGSVYKYKSVLITEVFNWGPICPGLTFLGGQFSRGMENWPPGKMAS